MRSIKELMDLSQQIVDYARKKGVKEAQVITSDSKNFSVEVLEGEIEELKQAGSTSMSIQVIIDNKTASCSSSDLTKDTLFKLVDGAIARCKLSSEDPFNGLAKLMPIKADIKSLNLFDPEVMNIPPEKKVALAKEIEKIALSAKGIRQSNGSSFGTYNGKYMIVNSNGFSASYDTTSCSLGVWLQAGEGDHFFEDGWSDSNRFFAKLDDPDKIAKIAVDRVTRLVGAKKVKTQKVPVILEPNMTSRVLGFLAQCVSGRSIYMKQSFLADMYGQKIAGDNINVIDNGLMPGLPGTRPFDSDAVPTQKTAVIENGILKNFLLDVYAARKLKMEPTGNASGTTNFYLEAGQYSPEDIIKSVDNGLLLTKTIGQGTVATTGDISTGAFGLWIENGVPAYPVAEITISSNLGKMLKEVEMIGNDLTFRRSVSGPTIKVKEMTISGV
jgi:PmbA protein